MGDMTAQAAIRPRPQTWDLVVRPRTALVRSTVLSIVFSAVPLAVALVWVSFPFRLWALMATVVAVLAVVVGAVAVRIGTAYVGVDATSVAVHGVLSRTKQLDRACVDRVVLVERAALDHSVRELLAFAEDGTYLFRMRSDVWGRSGQDRVVEELGTTVLQEPRALSAREIAERWPTSRAWFERRGPVIGVGLAAVVLVGALLAVETAGLLAR